MNNKQIAKELIRLAKEIKSTIRVRDKAFIADQLVNAWEHNSPKEMYDFLASELERTMSSSKLGKLARLVKDWYRDSRRRMDVLMMKEDINDWIENIF